MHDTSLEGSSVVPDPQPEVFSKELHMVQDASRTHRDSISASGRLGITTGGGAPWEKRVVSKKYNYRSAGASAATCGNKAGDGWATHAINSYLRYNLLWLQAQ